MTPRDDETLLVYQRPRASWGHRVAAGVALGVFVLGVGTMAWQVMGGALPAALAVALMVGVYLVQARLRPTPVLRPTRVFVEPEARTLVLAGSSTLRVPFAAVASVSYGKHVLSDGIALDAVTLHRVDAAPVVWTVHDAAASAEAAGVLCESLGLPPPTAPEGPGPGTNNDDDGKPDPEPVVAEDAAG